MESKLKAYLVAFNVIEMVTNIETGKIEQKSKVRTTCVVAYSKKEAGDIFVKWLKLNNMYDEVTGVAVSRAKRTQQNAHLLTKAIYDKEMALFN